MQECDVLVLTETHSTLEAELAFSWLEGVRTFWSRDISSRAGVGILLRETFPAKGHGWRQLVPGRAAELWLSGSLADVSITGAYFALGLNENVYDDEDNTITAHESRRRMPIAIGVVLPNPEDCLSFVIGDFNWVDDELGARPERQQRTGKVQGHGRGGPLARAHSSQKAEALAPLSLHASAARRLLAAGSMLLLAASRLLPG